MDDWEQVKAVRAVQGYIETHLNKTITLLDLAKACGYSPWHMERLFKAYMGQSPFAYLQALRLSKAAINLRDSKEKEKIVDVALDYVFDSHEGFTRAFSKRFGVAPSTYRQKPGPIPLFLPFAAHSRFVTERRYNMEKETSTIFVQVIERSARKAIIKRGLKATHYFAYCEEVGCDVWGILVSVKEALYEPAGFWLPESFIKPGTSQYVQGVEVPIDYVGQVPEGFEMVDLPSCHMMIFQGEPYDDDDFGIAINHLQKQIERYNPNLYGYAWADELAPRFQLEPQGYRGYIEGRPVRPLK